jgi:hypothetical protein
MPSEQPVQCSLDPDHLGNRVAKIRALGNDALISVCPEGALRFRADEAVRDRLEQVIAAESRCCAFLDFDLRDEAGALVLTVSAPEGAESIASGLVEAFASDATIAPVPRGQR